MNTDLKPMCPPFQTLQPCEEVLTIITQQWPWMADTREGTKLMVEECAAPILKATGPQGSRLSLIRH